MRHIQTSPYWVQRCDLVFATIIQYLKLFCVLWMILIASTAFFSRIAQAHQYLLTLLSYACCVFFFYTFEVILTSSQMSHLYPTSSITQVTDLLEGIRCSSLPLLCERIVEVPVRDWLVAPARQKDGDFCTRKESREVQETGEIKVQRVALWCVRRDRFKESAEGVTASLGSCWSCCFIWNCFVLQKSQPLGRPCHRLEASPI